MSATPSSPPPPLSLRVASHPLYNEALQRVLLDLDDKHVSGIWDVGCGPGADLLEFARRGVPPSKLVGLDLEPGFEAMGRSVATSKGFRHLPYHFCAQDVFSDTLVDPPCRPALILAYRLFHLHPPSSHLQMLRTLLSLPDSSTKPTYILGLHRALPPSSTSAFYPASSSSQDSDHWLWAADDWGALLREAASDGYQVGWVWKAGLALERGVVEWWIKSCPPTAAAEGSIR